MKSLAASSDKNSTGGFVVFFSVVLFPRPVSLPGGLASWTLYRPKGYLRRFLSSSSSLKSVFLELFVAAFRLAMSNSTNFAWRFLFFCVSFKLLNPTFRCGFTILRGPLVAQNFTS